MAEEKELVFELDTVASKDEGLCIRGGYEKTLALVKDILVAHPSYDITNDAEKKQAKETRATLKKCIDAIDRTRIDAVADYTKAFTDQCNEIKALFEERRKEFDTKIKTYEESQKVVVADTTKAGKKYTATIKFTDEKLVKKLTDFCAKNGCELTIK